MLSVLSALERADLAEALDLPVAALPLVEVEARLRLAPGFVLVLAAPARVERAGLADAPLDPPEPVRERPPCFVDATVATTLTAVPSARMDIGRPAAPAGGAGLRPPRPPPRSSAASSSGR